MKEIISLIEQHAQAKKELNSLRRSLWDIEEIHGDDSPEAKAHISKISKARKLVISLANKLNPREDKTASSLRYN